MARYGMLIHTKKCIGCYACRVACQRQNNLLPTEDFIRYEEHEVGTYPNVRVETVPLQCMHCEDAPCVAVCPTGAAYIGADGIVGVDHGRCIGCLYCMAACPYTGVRSFNWEEPKYHMDYAVGGKDVPAHQKHVVEKCTFCKNLIDRGEEPACMQLCPGRARYWGDLDDPDSAVSKAIEGRDFHLMMESAGTSPNVYYLK